MKKFVFATNNAHKLQEVEAIVGEKIEILSLKDIGCQADIPETADTLEGNALQKARFIYETYHRDCFADDTGLEVEALNSAPGVYSARYAGDAHNSEANMRKLLQDLEGIENRKARFRTVFALILNGKEHLFEGIVNGQRHRQRTDHQNAPRHGRLRLRPDFRARRLYTDFCRNGRRAEEQNQPPGRGGTKAVQVPEHAVVDNHPITDKKDGSRISVLFYCTDGKNG